MIPKIICWIFGHKRYREIQEWNEQAQMVETSYFLAANCNRCGKKLYVKEDKVDLYPPDTEGRI